MAVFKTPEEAYELFKKTMEKIQANEAVYKALAGAGLVVAIKVPSLGAQVNIVSKDGKLNFEFGDSSSPADGTLTFPSDENMVKFWQGKIDPMMGMAKGEFKAEGNIGALTKLIPAIKPVYPLFNEALKEAGREDLL